jgi:hypothetical protein
MSDGGNCTFAGEVKPVLPPRLKRPQTHECGSI